MRFCSQISSLRNASLLIAVFYLSGGTVFAQEAWPEFRGPDGNGHTGGACIPDSISDSQIKWSTPIHGKGWSSPVISSNQVWLTTATEDGREMSAICVDLMSGETQHDIIIHRNDAPAFCHSENSYASPTPAIEDGRIYLHFGSYGTTCLNTETAEVIWQRTDLQCDHFRGPASSPILYGDLLIVAFDGFDLQYVVALDKQTGETVWKTDRDIDYGTDNGDFMKAYSTAAVFEIDGEALLVSPSAIATTAYRPLTGEIVWTVYHDGMNASCRPVITPGGLVLITNGMGRMVAVDPKGRDDISDSNIEWQGSESVAKKASLLVIQERIYMIADNGILSCLDAESGETLWRERIGGTFAASPLFDGDKILLLDREGNAIVCRPSDEFELIAQSELGAGFMASPAVAGNKIILRSTERLICIE
ncbi:MAG: PQQ-binding-like beta-propeller repeat protein [Planctomycetota bacterium]